MSGIDIITTFFRSVGNLIINCIGFFMLPRIRERIIEDFKIVPYERSYYGALLNLWKICGNFSGRDRLFLKLFGNKGCFLLTNKRGELVGFKYHYFNLTDLLNRRIHAAFVGIDPKIRHQGCAKLLVTEANDSLRNTKWLRGLTTKFPKDQVRKFPREYGYRVIGSTFDEKTKEEIYVAIHDFLS
ncbi:MAG: hypothetical protein ACFFCW_10985 [Candidatus Hodarchaeota archaeon]